MGALTQTLGEKGYDRIVSDLRDAVNDVMIPDNGSGVILDWMGKSRTFVSQSIFGFNLSQALQNLADVTEARKVGLGRFAKASLERLAQAWVMSRERST